MDWMFGLTAFMAIVNTFAMIVALVRFRRTRTEPEQPIRPITKPCPHPVGVWCTCHKFAR